MVCTTETCGPNVRRAGIPLTDAQRTIRHQQIYGTDQLPTRGTGLSGVTQQNVRRAGVPLTDAQRNIRHQQIYGTDQLPTRGTGLSGVTQQKLEFSLGDFVGGVVIGFIIGGFLLTATGRDIGYSAGQRVAHKLH